MTISVGVIGAGIMGADHARTVDRFVSGARVEVIVDLDRERAAQVADELPDARAGTDAMAVIEDPAVDAVVIASHDSTHAALCLAALHHRKPVLCEKPLAPTLAECQQIVDTELSVLADGRPLISLGFMRRFDPGYVQLRSALRSGEIGRALLVHSTGRGVSSGPGTTNESAVTNSAIHDFDIVPWLLDSPIVRASWHAGRSTSNATGFTDPQVILLWSADGVLSTVEMLLNARYGYDIRCEVVGESGALQIAEPARLRRDAERRHSTGYPADWRPRFADAYRLELQSWIDGLNGRPTGPLARATDGLRAGAVADAVIASMHDNGAVVQVRPTLEDGG